MISNDMALFVVILISGFYMAWNIGANDVANAMGTSVGSGALTLKHAVIIAAILEFSGALFFGSYVTETVQKNIVDPNIFIHDPRTLVYGMLAALLASGTWLQLASYFGLPVSTTHSIVGAVIGFGLIVGGVNTIRWETVGKIIASWIISPLAGGIIAYYMFSFLRKQIFYTHHPVDAVKKIIPLLVFFLVLVIVQILGSTLIKNLQINYTEIQILVFGTCLGILGAGIGYFFIQKIQVNPHFEHTHFVKHEPEMVKSLNKAKKHLIQVNLSSTGDLYHQSEQLIYKIDSLSQSLTQSIEKKVSSSEYSSVENIFSYLQIISACLMAFAHGANDVANAIGPLAAAIGTLRTGVIAMQTSVPIWILALGGSGIIIGLATWGWRVIETIGKKITELTPTRGFVAEFSAASTILVASRLGMPISTTHTLVGAVVGVGLARGIEALNLGMTRDIVLSWIVTLPAGAALSVVFFYSIQWIFG